MLYFHGFGHFHPENEIDNAFLESLDIGTTDEWIMSRVGIRSRRTVLPLDYIRATKNRDVRGAAEASLYSNAETAKRAAMMAIERAGLRPEDIGMVVAGGCSPERTIPTEAASLAKALGIARPALDIQSACTTFGAQCHMLGMMGAALPDYVLLSSPENSTRVIDFSDRASAILFGDAASAVVVSPRVPSRARMTYSTFNTDPSGADDVVIPRVGHFAQNGAAVHKFASKMMSTLLREIQGHFEPERARRLFFVGHQANLTMLEGACKRCEVAPDRHLFNIVDYGNQAAAGAPVVLSQRWDRFEDGDTIAMVVVGSGLSWSSMQIEFGPKTAS